MALSTLDSNHAAGDAAVCCTDLVRTFDSVTAVDRVSVSLKRGAILAIVGSDGAGKTTLLRMLCGVLTPDSGEVQVFGVDMRRNAEAGKARLGYMPQRFSLYGDLSGRENLRFFADLYEVPAASYRERSRTMLADFRLSDFVDMPSSRLSGGMKQKLALACTLVHEPELLILDEPTAGVDPVSRRQFWRLLYGLNARGISILVSTPYMDEAEHATSVALMHRGRLIAYGTPTQLRNTVSGRVIAISGVPSTAARRALRDHPLAQSLELFGESVHALVPNAAASIPAFMAALEAAGLHGASVSAVEPSLEDAFVWTLDSAAQSQPR